MYRLVCKDRIRLQAALWTVCLAISTEAVFADGMVIAEEFRPKVQIPRQQALIHFEAGVESLVIETSFLGTGTNFAWVVPLPAVPDVKPVGPDFFVGLQRAFRPSLVHWVHPYYAGVLFVCGLGFLGWRSLRGEVSWWADAPLCILLAIGAGLAGKHAAYGVIAAVLACCLRLFTCSPAAFAHLLLLGTTFAAILVFVPSYHGPRLIETMGGSDSEIGMVAGVNVLNHQRAGLFDATTIRADSPEAVLVWLKRNGFETPVSATGAINSYVRRGWVFVASKARRSQADESLATLHPLAFTFPVRAPVYPTMLTAIDNNSCAIDLFVFGSRRSLARHFNATRCDHLTTPKFKRKLLAPGLRIRDPEVMALIGDSTIGTKLSGTLSPAMMSFDVEIRSAMFWRTGALVYSRLGALTVALNVALPTAALAWLLVGASRGGWNINEKWITRWRWKLVVGALCLGLTIFLALPKVEVETVRSVRLMYDDW